jgi:hypothetical protein
LIMFSRASPVSPLRLATLVSSIITPPTFNLRWAHCAFWIVLKFFNDVLHLPD